MSSDIITINLKNTKQYIILLNGLFQLTAKEVIILEAFINKYRELESLDIDVFSAEIKKQIAKSLDIDNFNTLNVYVKRLKDKRALIYKDGSYKINSILLDRKKGIRFRWEEKTN